MTNSKIKSTIIIFIGFLLTMSCEDPTGSTTPESATIAGTITFSGTWPGDDNLYLSLSSNWPPQGTPSASSIITSTDLQSNTYDYIFENVTFIKNCRKQKIAEPFITKKRYRFQTMTSKHKL